MTRPSLHVARQRLLWMASPGPCFVCQHGVTRSCLNVMRRLGVTKNWKCLSTATRTLKSLSQAQSQTHMHTHTHTHTRHICMYVCTLTAELCMHNHTEGTEYLCIRCIFRCRPCARKSAVWVSRIQTLSLRLCLTLSLSLSFALSFSLTQCRPSASITGLAPEYCIK